MLIQRVISGGLGIALMLIFVIKGGSLFFLGVLFLTLRSLYEFNNSLINRNIYPLRWLGYLTAVAYLFSVFYFNTDKLFPFILLISLLTGFIFFLINYKKVTLEDVIFTVFEIVYIVFLFGYLILVRNMENGKNFIWLAFLSVWANDTFAYFFGIKFGKHKLAPLISPKKTIEGSIAGVIGSVLILIIYTKYIPQPYLTNLHIIFWGISLSLLAQAGDLTASSLKRFSNIKDYSNLIPGHGGILDRFDSVLFAFPVIYYYITYLLDL
ncbi:MAG: phosphatidate cytidylyltransferase [Thermosediminibacterales bacterium]|nr:phosphatidate cytidylyltransferase [Thermosediminibacterales bacterium]